MRILDADRCEVVDNADWLAPMALSGVLDFARQMTVAQLLERDDFARRFRSNVPISLSELLYPMLQGIDSVEVRADIELGGTDQTFNNLVGRELQRSRGQAPQAVLTVPLLVGTDGVEKMGKSLNNFIAINDPPGEQFGKLMSIPDSAVVQYATLCTDLHPREVADIAAAVQAGGARAGEAKRRMARAVVMLYHGEAAGKQAEGAFDATFRDHAVPQDAPEHRLEGTADPVHLPTVLVSAGLAASTSAARRLVDSGGVRLDGARVAGYDLPRAEVVGRVLAVGKRQAVRVVETG
jgi:tyrosyl-tRNA synthetase